MLNIRLILSILALVVVLSSARNPASTTTCSLSNSLTQCQNGACPSIVACIQEYAKSYANIVITVPDGDHYCNQTETHTLNFNLHIDIQPEGQSSTPTFFCPGRTSFLRLQTSFVFTINISNIVIEATETAENRGSLIYIQTTSYSYPNNNLLTLNNVLINNAHSIPKYGAYEAGSITLNSISLILNGCTITNSKSTGYYSSASVMRIYSTSLSINNSTITYSNSSTGNYGISFSGTNFNIYNSLFDGNIAESNFIYASASSGSVIVQSSKFTNNIAKYGSCFNVNSYSINFDSNVFDNNIGQYGSAIYSTSSYNSYYSYFFTNNNFTNNVASDTGTLYLSTQGYHYLTGSIFQNNVAYGAADIYFYKQRLTLVGGTFINSTSSNPYSYSQYPGFPKYVLDMANYYDYNGYECDSSYPTIEQNSGSTTCMSIDYYPAPNYSSDDNHYDRHHTVAFIITASVIGVVSIVSFIVAIAIAIRKD
ncbi:hypothetical protein PPL_11790 [Heterostelium album PN500]|uniref:Right handed beta helix domain-containing protein n=1 Tax=Heterostelium pallidum (strain ATCC 26659 / Pp 5 / PN500) TaxID=670386 RepID=D3BUH0_HETP5|nr:hypothetical protein PPL_11790 [Heterostelium album PN500]EFA74758.1 hypothetical protein PPL_11790 [Heterostelium album PN500]|eukprot:XP_020426892.1 hypothetical protein PPL_11790 [Heterostelium album PN500]